MFKFPLKRTYKNILLNKNGNIYAYYKLSPEIISRANIIEQENYKKKFNSILDSLVKYKDVHIQMLPKNMNLEERFEILSKDFDKRYFQTAKYYSNETINILKHDLGTISQYEFYIGVRIDGLSLNLETVKDTVVNVLGKTTDILANILGYEIQVTDEYFYKFIQAEKNLYGELQTLNFDRCSEDELSYLIRYNFLGNTVHDFKYESSKRTVFDIANAEIDNREKRILKIDTEDYTVYKSCLVLESTEITINNIHLFEKLQSLPFPVEIQLKMKTVDKTIFDLKLSNKAKKTNEELKDEYQGKGKLNDESLRNSYLIDRLDTEYQQGKNFVEWLLVVVLSDTNKELLKKQISILKQEIKMWNRSKEKGNNLVCPIADQLQLFYLFLQGQELGLYRNWLQITTTESLSEMLFGVTQRLGTNIGFYIGRIDKYLKSKNLSSAISSSREIVLFHQMLANKGIIGAKTDSPHIAITGKTGKGKSFLAKLLYIYSLMLDIKTLYFDPKSEMKNWFTKVIEDEESNKQYPLFVDLLKSISYLTIDYTKEENYGMLDPISFLSGEEAKELTKEMFFEIIDVSDKLEVETAILEAVRNVVERKEAGEIVGSLHIIKELQNHKDEIVQKAGNNLYEKTQNGMLKLLVYDGTNKGISLKNKSTVLQVFGLDLPEATDSKDTYTDIQKKSLLVMQIIGKFMGKFGSNHSEETMIFVDEAWVFNVTRVGRAVKRQLERIGRSFNNALVFITQLVNDIKDENGIAGNYGCIFAFDEEQDRENILNLLGLEYNENNKTNYDILANTVKGQCIFKDFYGRVSKLSVHCLFDEWTQSFKTVEKTETAIAEERFN